MIKHPEKVDFSYRDNLWHGSDLLSTGVASFGHVSGVHYQNLTEWADYLEAIERGELPLARAMRPTAHQLLVRELILQLKRGHVEAAYFQNKFGVDILAEWQDAWNDYESQGLLEIADSRVRLTRLGLLQADGLLPAFFEPQHQGVRYT